MGRRRYDRRLPSVAHPSAARLSASAARRIALGAQGLADPRPTGTVDSRRLRAAIARMGLLQLDSVNVFCRSHYMPLFSRLGPYPNELLDRMAGHRSTLAARPPRARRELFEYWAHEASLLSFELQPLLRWRMASLEQEGWGSMVRVAREAPDLVARVLELVRESGPLRSADTGVETPARRAGEMWNWHQGKAALEHLFFIGRITAAERVNFERRYDLTERVLPESVMRIRTPSREDAQRELARIAARALGVACEPDIGDYFRLPRADSKRRVAELVDSGELLAVEVAGWQAPAYLWHDARRPRRARGRALLSPFDPLVWFRPRAERLFGFRYRLEIYTPAHKRIHGYYVLPFLLGERLAARVDLKADRAAGTLLVRGAFAEPGIEPVMLARELGEELRMAAAWQGLERVRVNQNGDLAAELGRALS